MNKKMLFVLVFAFVVIFIHMQKKDPPKNSYLASYAHIVFNKKCIDSLFILEGAQAYQSIVDTPRAFLCRYPLAYIKSPLLKGSCFFGNKKGSRIYTRLPGSPGEIYFDESTVIPLDSFYHSPKR